MARARNIKPGFFHNEELVECSFAARLCFIGLWTLADREGRMEDRPKRIKMALFPGDDLEIESLLDELESKALIQRYQGQGMSLICIPKFTKHQRPHQNETPSEFPPPCDQGEKDGEPRLQALRSESPLLNADTGMQKDGQSRFDEFWSVWPKKKAKPDAQKAWKQMGCDQIADDLIAHVGERKARDPEWIKDNGKFIPHAGTFLRGRRWEDEWEAAEAEQETEDHWE